MNPQNLEQGEKPTISTRTITGEELKEMIYQGESTPQDQRFLPISEGGVFKYFFLDNLVGLQRLRRRMADTDDSEYLFYQLVEADGKVVGLSELEKDPYKQNNFWVKFVSVDPEYHGQGHASRLIEEMFLFAKERSYSLQGSTYSDNGSLKLKKKFKEFSEKYGVVYEDPDERRY